MQHIFFITHLRASRSHITSGTLPIDSPRGGSPRMDQQHSRVAQDSLIQTTQREKGGAMRRWGKKED